MIYTTQSDADDLSNPYTSVEDERRAWLENLENRSQNGILQNVFQDAQVSVGSGVLSGFGESAIDIVGVILGILLICISVYVLMLQNSPVGSMLRAKK